jgi:hypothetical protein
MKKKRKLVEEIRQKVKGNWKAKSRGAKQSPHK